MQPYLRGQGLKKLEFNQILDILNIENIQELEYISCCLNETLRLDPPIIFSSTATFNEKTEIQGYTFTANEQVYVYIGALHRNPDQWIEPEKYIPDRFNPSSPYYLTPSGKKRHPMSFGPFLGGKRVCLGKSLADVITRLLLTAIIY